MDSHNFKPDSSENEDNNFRGSQTFGRENFKTFNLLRQQDDFISKFESNLQKTLNMIYDPSNPGKIAKDTPDSQNPVPVRRPLQDIQNKETRDHSPVTDHLGINKIPSNKNESISPRARNTYTDTRSSLKRDTSSEQNNSLSKKIEELSTENERLKSEIIKIKTDSLKKYEQLKKNNDELLVSYEERSKIALKNLKEQNEKDMNDLKEELDQSKKENENLKENLRKQKEKMGMTILELEKEKHELLSKMSKLQFKNLDFQPTTSASSFRKDTKEEQGLTASNLVLDQILKEKNELEKKYNDLFSSYHVLLDHNKALSQRFEITTKEKTKKEKSTKLKEKGSPDLKSSKFKEKDTKHIEVSNKKIESSGTKKKSKRDRDDDNHESFNSHEDEKFLKSNRSSSVRPPAKNNIDMKNKDNLMMLEDLKSFDDPSHPEKIQESMDSERNLSAKASRKKNTLVQSEKKTLARSSSNLERDVNKHSKLQESSNSKKEVPTQQKQKSKDHKEGITKSKPTLKENIDMNVPKQISSSVRNTHRSSSKGLESSRKVDTHQRNQNKENNIPSKSNHPKKIPLYTKIAK